jgi:hypothetical protein
MCHGEPAEPRHSYADVFFFGNPYQMQRGCPGKAFVTPVAGVVIVTALTTYLKYLSAIQLPF